MIHITQGHELGIGLEVFFKSLFYLPKSALEHFIFYGYPQAVVETLNSLNVPFKVREDSIELFKKKISFNAISEESLPQSTSSLLKALENIKKDEVLITLPTSKTELIYNGVSAAGYTEFFRKYFNNQNISMVFGGPHGFTALLTDHIPLKDVSHVISSALIENKLSIIVDGLKTFFEPPNTIVIAGINPHAGEGGVLGSEEVVFKSSIKVLRKKFPDINFLGPLPGDTLHFESDKRENKLFVYSYHDQGLPTFKEQTGLFGVNISLGMPFLRLSVDHGTAFSLYGKNQADCRGCLYTLQKALQVQNDN